MKACLRIALFCLAPGNWNLPLCLPDGVQHRATHFSWIRWVSGALSLFIFLGVAPAQTSTRVRPDGTLGTTVQRPSPGGHTYTIRGGTRYGANLFHSFGHFRVGRGDTVSFRSAAGIENLFSRITGGEPSLINGTLQTMDGVNLYLLNPRGVLFGPYASLDVQGSFYASTAHLIRFPDGGTFAAQADGGSTLTTAPPAAFGFLQANPAGITVQGSRLNVPTNATLAMVGGDVKISGGHLLAPGGRITLTGVASAGDISLRLGTASPRRMADLLGHAGTILLTDAALLDVSGDAGGTITLRSGRLQVAQASKLQANTLGAADGHAVAVDIAAAEQVELTSGAEIRSDTLGGDAGAIEIRAGQMRLSQGAALSAASTGTGSAGNIRLTAANTLFSSNSSITTATTGSQGGEIDINAGLFHMRDSKMTTTVTAGGKRAGHVTITAQLVVLQNSQIRADAQGGTGGNISITAAALLADPASAVTASSRPGVAGKAKRDSSRPSVAGEAALDASPPSVAGNITIHAPVTNVSGILTPVPEEVRPEESLLHNACAARLQQGRISSLVARQRDGVPETPAGALANRLYVPPPRHQTELSTTAAEAKQPRTVARAQRTADLKCSSPAL